MSEPTPNVESVDDDQILEWESGLFIAKWGEGVHFTMADVGYYPNLTPDPNRPWCATCLGPANLRIRDSWHATPQEAKEVIEEHVQAYCDATWPLDDEQPTITIPAVQDA